MSTLSQFAGGGVKSIQRGSITILGTAGATATATIAAVNVNKTMVNFLGSNTQNDLGNINTCRLTLTNSTTVTASRTFNNSGESYCNYEVIEFY